MSGRHQAGISDTDFRWVSAVMGLDALRLPRCLEETCRETFDDGRGAAERRWKGFNSCAELKDHDARVHSKPYGCQWRDCPVSARDALSLKGHYVSNHGWYGCQIDRCPEVFADVGAVKHHHGRRHGLMAGCTADDCPRSSEDYSHAQRHRYLQHLPALMNCPHRRAGCRFANWGPKQAMVEHIDARHRGIWCEA